MELKSTRAVFNHNYSSTQGIFISKNVNNKDEKSTNQGILFLDRDGVIIEEKHYLSDPKLVKIISGANDVIKRAVANQMRVVIVTNQSGIGRGLFGWEDYLNVTNSMLKLLASEASSIDLILACPMHPDAGLKEYKYPNHPMRKPNAGMINYATKLFNVESSECIMVGDKKCDIDAGIQGGIQNLFHVETGHGAEHRDDIIKSNIEGKIPEINCIESIKELKPYLQLKTI